MAYPKKPTALKILQGNPGKRPLPQNEPKPAPIAPTCPAWVNSDGKKLWKFLAPKLERLGLLTEIDGGALACCCNEYGTYVELVREIKKKKVRTFTTDNGYEAPIPEISMANKAFVNYKAMITEFGLTPASRSRIDVKISEEKDDMEQLLSGVK
jgi:P27 family predicted phage terminase small subunit